MGGMVTVFAGAATIWATGWTATDLIVCFSFAALLIVLGTTAGFIGRYMQIRSFESQATAFGLYKDGVTVVARSKPQHTERRS